MKRLITTIGKKKPAIISVWLGATPQIATVPEFRTKAHWLTWAPKAFALPDGAADASMVWNATAKAEQTHYLITLRLVKA